MKVKSFCENHHIALPDFDSHYVARKGQARHQQDDQITISQHQWVNVHIVAIDFQLKELNSKLPRIVWSCLLLVLHWILEIDDFCKLVEKFYPEDFNELEKSDMRVQFQHYKLDMLQTPS